YPEADQACETNVRVRQRVVDRWRDDGVQPRRGPPRHFLRDQHVGEQRSVRTVLLGGAHGNDDRVMLLQKSVHFESGHLAQKNSRWLHGAPWSAWSGSDAVKVQRVA